jgi:hypothetical protein
MAINGEANHPISFANQWSPKLRSDKAGYQDASANSRDEVRFRILRSEDAIEGGIGNSEFRGDSFPSGARGFGVKLSHEIEDRFTIAVSTIMESVRITIMVWTTGAAASTKHCNRRGLMPSCR